MNSKFSEAVPDMKLELGLVNAPPLALKSVARGRKAQQRVVNARLVYAFLLADCTIETLINSINGTAERMKSILLHVLMMAKLRRRVTCAGPFNHERSRPAGAGPGCRHHQCNLVAVLSDARSSQERAASGSQCTRSLRSHVSSLTAAGGADCRRANRTCMGHFSRYS